MSSDKCEQPLYFPESMLAHIQTEATRTDRSLSGIVQVAWMASAEQIAAADEDILRARVRGFTGDKRKQTLYFPRDMLDAIQAQATRIDASVSLVVQAAWLLGADAAAGVPTAG